MSEILTSLYYKPVGASRELSPPISLRPLALEDAFTFPSMELAAWQYPGADRGIDMGTQSRTAQWHLQAVRDII